MTKMLAPELMRTENVIKIEELPTTTFLSIFIREMQNLMSADARKGL